MEYDPSLGNFISLDPLEIANRYGYVNGNPANFNDPSGFIRNLPSEFVADCSDIKYSLNLLQAYQLSADGFHCAGQESDKPVKEIDARKYVDLYGIRLVRTSPVCPNNSLAECNSGCWTNDQIKIVEHSIGDQLTRLGKENLPFVPKNFEIVMSSGQAGTGIERFAALTCIASEQDKCVNSLNYPRIILWENGGVLWGDQSPTFSKFLITHEFGHLVVQYAIAKGNEVHNTLNTTRIYEDGKTYTGYMYLGDIDSVRGDSPGDYIAVWQPFDEGGAPSTANDPRIVGRIYGDRGIANRNTQNLADERAAESYAIWVHSPEREFYSSDPRVQGEVQFQIDLWDRFFELTD